MKNRKLLGIGTAVILATGVGIYAFAAASEEDHADFGRSHATHQGMMGQGMMGHGMMGMGHMMGRDAATASDMSAIHELAIGHDRIRRSVTNLPDGIRTITESDDPRIAQLIREHVARMGQRVRAGTMMGVPIESPAVHRIYANKDKIRTTSEATAAGIVVTQTSSDPSIVALLQEHAVEVSDLVSGGMAAMHAAMMRNHGGQESMMSGMPGMMRMHHGMRH
jgi:hypothetical protein